MKESNLKRLIDDLSISMKHMEDAKTRLNEAYKLIGDSYQETKEEPKDKKVKLTIKVENPFKEELEGLTDKEIEQLRKDLEEIMNDFTGK